jgi:molecular chaperone HtpG
LGDYVARMKPDQPGIYWISGESLAACRNSPHLEALRQHGYEVLLMADPVDEWVVAALPEFEGKKLLSAAKGGLELPEGEDRKKAREQSAAELKDLLGRLQAALGGAVKEVRVTDRLTESPACLVTEAGGLSPHLERILRANGQEVPEQPRVLEVNPAHPVVQKLKKLAEQPREDEPFEEWSSLLYAQALLAAGTLPADPARLARALGKLMSR